MSWGLIEENWGGGGLRGELIDYKTSLTTHPQIHLRGFGGNQGLEFSRAPLVIVERRRRCEHHHLRKIGSPVPAGPPILGDGDKKQTEDTNELSSPQLDLESELKATQKTAIVCVIDQARGMRCQSYNEDNGSKIDWDSVRGPHLSV